MWDEERDGDLADAILTSAARDVRQWAKQQRWSHGLVGPKCCLGVW